MSTIFVSHSHHDRVTASELREWLAGQGFASLFLDFHEQDGIPAGTPWEKELHRQLRRSDAVIALCSGHFTSSRWCFAEIAYAKVAGKAIIPIQLDASPRHELLADIQSVDFTSRSRDAAGAYAALDRALEARGIRRHGGGAWTGERPPYPGLAAFQEADAPVFFGREDDVNEAVAEIRRLLLPDAAGWLVIFGASGCGKSSLLRAGVLPKLRADAQDWLVVDPFRPGAQPLTRLAQALAQTFERHRRPMDWKAIRSTLQSREPNALRDVGEDLRFLAKGGEARVLLIVDQLEEALLHLEAGGDAAGPREDASQFLEVLRRLVDLPGSPFLIVATLRSDFLAEFQTNPALRGSKFATLMLGPLSHAGFERVIRGPAELARLELEDGLTELMVQDTETTDALPMLAFALRELYERHGQDRLLTIAEYQQEPPIGIAGLQGSLALAAEEVLARQSPPMTDGRMNSLRNSLLSMVVLGERGQPARRPARWNDLSSEAHALLEQFVQARLLVARENDGQREIEVAHEALFRSWSRLRAWVDENRRFLAWRRELERPLAKWKSADASDDVTWDGVANGRRRTGLGSRSALLKEDDLVRARAHLQRYGELLNADERGFVRASIAADSRRRWAIRVIVGGTIAILAAVALFARQQSLRATEKSAAAKRATLLAAARTFPRDPTREGALLRETTDGSPPAMRLTARILDGHTNPVRSIAFSPDGARILTSSEDNTARLWDADGSGEPVILSGHQMAVTVATFDATGKRVLTGSEDHTARVWNADGSGRPRELAGHGDGIGLAAFSPDGKLVLTVSRRLLDFDFGTPDNTARIWDLERSAEPRILSGHTATITGASFSGDGKWVVTASEDKTARVWKTDGSDSPIVLRDPDEAMTAVAFSPDAALVVTGSPRGLIHVWKADGSGKPRLLAGHTGAITALVFGRDGQQLISGSEDGSARVWSLAGAARPVLLAGHTGAVTAMALSPDGTRVATASADRTARIWNTDGTHKDPFSQLFALVPDGFLKSITRLSTMFRNGQDMARRVSEEWMELSGHDGRLTGLAWSPDGRRIATASADGTARVWQLDGPREPLVFEYHGPGPSWSALSRDGERMLQVQGGAALLRNADGSGNTVSVGAPTNNVIAAGFGPDASLVVTATGDRTARIWNVTGERPVEIAVSRSLPEGVRSVFFHPDGKRVAALARREVWLWNVQNPAQSTAVSPAGDLWSAAFTPDGRYLLTQSPAGFQIWDADGSGKPRDRRVPSDLPTPQGFGPAAHRPEVRMYEGFRLTMDGEHIVACASNPRDADKKVYLIWRVRGDRSQPDTSSGYTYDFLLDALNSPGHERILLYADGTPFAGLCSDGPLSFARSPNGRRTAWSFALSLDEAPGIAAAMVTTIDVRTQLWRKIAYCFSVKDRVRLLGESEGDAARALGCCRKTVSVCRQSTFDACATAVAKNYADPLNPCAGD